MWIYISRCYLIKFSTHVSQEGVRHSKDHWDLAKDETQMKGWHIYDRHDKSVPYDVFIKLGDRPEKMIIKCRICLAHTAG